MKIFLRLSKDPKNTIRMVKDTRFVPKEDKEFIVYPIPPFLKNVKCKCGKSAHFVFDDMACMCLDCLNKQLVGSHLVKIDDISIPLTLNSIRKIKFEWSTNGDRWYIIYGRNIKPNDWNRFLNEIKKMIVQQKEILLDGDYTKETKEMVIY